VSRQQVQQNARAWAAETEGLAGLAQAATEGYSPRFRRELALQWGKALLTDGFEALATHCQAIEGIEDEASYIDNWLEREDHFGMIDTRTNDYARLGLGG
jgi:hypothetical protein